MAVTLLRHLGPEIAEGVCYGRSDIAAPLPDERALARMVANLGGPFDAIDTSPLSRCRGLADAIGQELGLDVRVDDRLAEIDFGRWEMVAWDDVPRAEIDRWAADVEHARPHGGESVAQVIARARGYLADCARCGGAILAVTHMGVIRGARAALGQPGALETKLPFGGTLTLYPKGFQ